ncbi:MAG: MFS transporter [Acidobacteriaceae bacterium]|nr:MFS transporter [Acidobacteriaceae bacterium]
MSEDGSKVARWGGRWGLIVFLWVAFALAYMARQSLYSIFPVLRSELGFTEMQLALTTTVFGWVYGVANAFGGGVADRVSKQRLIAASLLCSGAALALTGLASTPEWLLAGRSLMGLAQSFYVPAALALIGTMHGPETRARAIALHSTGQSVGVMAGGYYGAAGAESLGWRAMLWGLAGVTAAYALVLRLVLREAGPAAAAPAADGPPAPRTSFFRMLAIPSYALICLCAVAVGSNVWTLYTWLPDILHARFQLPMTQAAVAATTAIEVPMITGMFLGACLGDWVATRYRRGRLAVMVGGLLLACGCFYGIGAGESLAQVQAATALYAIFKGFYSANYIAFAFEVVPEDCRGLAVGSVNMISALGGTLAPLLVGALRPAYGTLFVFSALSLFGMLCALTLGVAGSRAGRKGE